MSCLGALLMLKISKVLPRHGTKGFVVCRLSGLWSWEGIWDCLAASASGLLAVWVAGLSRGSGCCGLAGSGYSWHSAASRRPRQGAEPSMRVDDPAASLWPAPRPPGSR
jgi:hypothetical protein